MRAKVLNLLIFDVSFVTNYSAVHQLKLNIILNALFYILTAQYVVGTSRDQSVCLQNYCQQIPICCNMWPEISFFIGYFFVYQTVNRGDYRKVPNNVNGKIWKNANHSHKRVKLLKLRTKKCLKDISLWSWTQNAKKNIKFIVTLARKMRLTTHWYHGDTFKVNMVSSI